MIHENKKIVEATERVAPLLRSIAVEIKERTRSVRDLETRLQAFETTRHVHLDEVARIEADLSVHRRELRQAEKELHRLGWTVEDELPVRFVHRGRNGDADVSFELIETGFRPKSTRPKT